MPTLGLPTPMFLIFLATVLAGSLGAIHYVVAHILLGRSFAEIPPPVLREGGLPEPGGGVGTGERPRATPGPGPAAHPRASDEGSPDGSDAADGADGADGGPGGSRG